ncbi:hypothetical protein EEL32_03650 [Brevibacillus laterosporus]|uniref:Uncharacterized protein n=1 Tax=Brevibacillus laterosporus TaxID=1465 RepID=A0A502IWK6_BRELA|nr:hypothetical protein [Brevibacillus laterosporus]QDX95440.1 hypothetical protein EEL30_26115 [Brevibacillus laterosporus]RAP23494.1 hypothetical protein C2W64_03110 [Brevibacillus laterosporus]TPG69355.1 hypothetical protein EEL31_13075 [Brevibacillus laterosporus]TPG90583.1 hypothetical protein EEL32_03650 [Brevibacillus laterosporus]
MKEVTIVFSSGAQTQFDVVDFAINKNLSGEFKGFTWTSNHALGPQPARINSDSVDLVLVEEIEEQIEEVVEAALRAEVSA